jgi:hypothetical protein
MSGIVVQCPHCGQQYHLAVAQSQLLECAKCHRQFSVTSPQDATASAGLESAVQEQLEKEERFINYFCILWGASIVCLGFFVLLLVVFMIGMARQESPDDDPKGMGKIALIGIMFVSWPALAALGIVTSYKKTIMRRRLRTADWLWQHGQRALAVERYKEGLREFKMPAMFTLGSFWKVDVPRMYRSVIDFASDNGNLDEAREWIELAVHLGMSVNLTNKEAVKIWNEVVARQ